MKIKCKEHGESDVTPEANGDLHCPACIREQIAAQMPDGGTVLCDKEGFPVVAFPYVPLQVTRLFDED